MRKAHRQAHMKSVVDISGYWVCWLYCLVPWSTTSHWTCIIWSFKREKKKEKMKPLGHPQWSRGFSSPPHLYHLQISLIHPCLDLPPAYIILNILGYLEHIIIELVDNAVMHMMLKIYRLNINHQYEVGTFLDTSNFLTLMVDAFHKKY